MNDWWFNLCKVPKFDRAWHEQDLAEELAEYEEAIGWLKRWSEISDVVYTCNRARWSGHNLKFPLKYHKYVIGQMYGLPKYTSRYIFYRRAGKKAGANKSIQCVRNPKKLYKLDKIIAEQSIDVDKEKLVAICEKQLRYWPLLP